MKNWIPSSGVVVVLFSLLSGESVTGLVRRRGKAAQFWNITLPDQNLIQDGLEGRREGRSFPLVLDSTEVYPFPPGTIFSVSCSPSFHHVLYHVVCLCMESSSPILNQDFPHMCSLLKMSFSFHFPAVLWDCNKSLWLQRGLLTEYAPWFPRNIRSALPGLKTSDLERKLESHVWNRTKGSEPSQPQEQTYTRNWREW